MDAKPFSLRKDHFPAPKFGDPLEAPRPSADLADFMLRRRSTPLRCFDLEAPDLSDDAVDLILRAGSRVPDHGKLAPWRFILFRGAARARFGETLAAIQEKRTPDCDPKLLELERTRFTRASTVIGVVSRVTPEHKIPEWEQVLSAGAACQNMLITAQALGYGGVWLTEWCAFDEEVGTVLGLGPHERIAGFLYFGAVASAPQERVRPELDDLVTTWQG